MRALFLALVVLGCSSKEDPPATVADAGEETTDAADAATTDKCATVKCSAPKVCDKVDGICKGVRFTKLGEACTATMGCTGVAGATCLEGDFPDGYCSITPCSVDNPCPVGAICAKVGGKQACFTACMIDADCRGGVEYKCQDLNQLVISGGLRRACYLPSITCAADADCPKPMTCKDGKTCTPPA